VDLDAFIAEREASRDERREDALHEGRLGGRNWFWFSNDPGVRREHKERDLFDFVDAMVLDTLRALQAHGEGWPKG
jgi:hypothetical protein